MKRCQSEKQQPRDVPPMWKSTEPVPAQPDSAHSIIKPCKIYYSKLNAFHYIKKCKIYYSKLNKLINNNKKKKVSKGRKKKSTKEGRKKESEHTN
jgi:superoxide dismutase